MGETLTIMQLNYITMVSGVEWNLRIKDRLGQGILSFIGERSEPNLVVQCA